MRRALEVGMWRSGIDRRKISFGSIVRARGGSESGLQCGAKSIFDPERRQSGGLRAFVGSGLNSRFVPKVRARSGARLRPGFDQ